MLWFARYASRQITTTRSTKPTRRTTDPSPSTTISYDDDMDARRYVDEIYWSGFSLTTSTYYLRLLDRQVTDSRTTRIWQIISRMCCLVGYRRAEATVLTLTSILPLSFIIKEKRVLAEATVLTPVTPFCFQTSRDRRGFDLLRSPIPRVQDLHSRLLIVVQSASSNLSEESSMHQ